MSRISARGEVHSPRGSFRVGCSERGLVLVELPPPGDTAPWEVLADEPPAAAHWRDEACRQLREHLDGQRTSFDVPLDLDGQTPFSERVLATLADVPFGSTITYGDLAAASGRPGAARAVGSVMASNPVAVVVPCHRVVAANGPGGYGGGLDLKAWLLALEGVELDR